MFYILLKTSYINSHTQKTVFNAQVNTANNLIKFVSKKT